MTGQPVEFVQISHLFRVKRVLVNFLHFFKELSMLSGSSLMNLKQQRKIEPNRKIKIQPMEFNKAFWNKITAFQ